jgi:uncharacterized protein
MSTRTILTWNIGIAVSIGILVQFAFVGSQRPAGVVMGTVVLVTLHAGANVLLGALVLLSKVTGARGYFLSLPIVLAVGAGAGALNSRVVLWQRGHVSDDYYQEFMRGQPVIDVHLHARPGREGSPRYSGPDLDKARIEYVRRELSENNVVLALAGGPPGVIEAWKRADDRFIVGPTFPCYERVGPDMRDCPEEWPDIAYLRERYRAGDYGSMGELLNVYHGTSPNDERMRPYWELAEEYRIPVGFHFTQGPPPAMRPEGCCPAFDESLASVHLMDSVLVRHPDLRLYLMHFEAVNDETLAFLKRRPGVYVDLSGGRLFMPTILWERSTRRLFDAGLGDRVMFGSDYIGTVRENIEILLSLDWLTEDQIRAVLFDNAADFLGLSTEERTALRKMAK